MKNVAWIFTRSRMNFDFLSMIIVYLHSMESVWQNPNTIEFGKSICVP